LASYRDDVSTAVRVIYAVRPKPEISGHSMVDASELRARAARYRRLADGLYDPRVIAEVQACARELETEAAWIERQDAYARGAYQRLRITG
jgi:hypothetical protein